MMKKEDVIPSGRSDQTPVIPSERSDPRDLHSRTGGRVEIPPLASLGRDDKRASNPFGPYPQRPPHIADWEELLLRYELTPRAMSNALELSPGDGSPNDLIAEYLGRIVAAERAALDWFAALRDGDEITAQWQPAKETGVADTLLAEFASLRARNFAGLQRRGIEVWDWAAKHSAYGEVTAFQFLSAIIARDAREMQAIRDAARTDVVC